MVPKKADDAGLTPARRITRFGAIQVGKNESVSLDFSISSCHALHVLPANYSASGRFIRVLGSLKSEQRKRTGQILTDKELASPLNRIYASVVFKQTVRTKRSELFH